MQAPMQAVHHLHELSSHAAVSPPLGWRLSFHQSRVAVPLLQRAGTKSGQLVNAGIYKNPATNINISASNQHIISITTQTSAAPPRRTVTYSTVSVRDSCDPDGTSTTQPPKHHHQLGPIITLRSTEVPSPLLPKLD